MKGKMSMYLKDMYLKELIKAYPKVSARQNAEGQFLRENIAFMNNTAEFITVFSTTAINHIIPTIRTRKSWIGP